jgi:hypothetical protein
MKRMMWLVVLGLALPACNSVYRAYPGPERPRREVAWIMVGGFTLLEIDSAAVGGIRPPNLHLLPGEHSLVVSAAWQLPHGVFQTGGPRLKPEVTNRIYFSVQAGHIYHLRWVETSSQVVGYATQVVTGMRIFLAEMDREVSRYQR